MRPDAFTSSARGDLVEVTGRERRRIYEAPGIFESVYGSVDVEDSHE
ncbi:MAG: hypothetical protein ACK5O2_13890 [Microthrixaceae bacterium]